MKKDGDDAWLNFYLVLHVLYGCLFGRILLRKIFLKATDLPREEDCYATSGCMAAVCRSWPYAASGAAAGRHCLLYAAVCLYKGEVIRQTAVVMGGREYANVAGAKTKKTA